MPDTKRPTIDTGWSNPPKLNDLQSDFNLTKTVHDAQARKVWNWLAELRPNKDSNQGQKGKTSNSSPFAAQYSNKTNASRSEHKSQLIRKNNEWRYTSLSEPFLNTPDVFNVDPKGASDVAAAKQNGLVLNNQINTQLDKVAFIDEYVRACADEGTVIVKVSWITKTQMVTKEYPTYEIRPATTQEQVERLGMLAQQPIQALPEELQQALQMTQQYQQAFWPVQVGTEVVEEEVEIVNRPEWEVCHFENVRVDPTANGDIDRAEFVIYSFESNKADLLEQGIYENLDDIVHESVNSDGEHESEWDDSGFEFQDDPRKKFVVYEYWGNWDIDGNGTTKPIVCSWVGGTIIRMEENPYPDGKPPFVSVPFMPIKDSIYGEPDGELLIDNQKIAGAVTRGMIDLLGRSANAQTGFKKGALDVINKRRYERGQDYEYNDIGDAQNSIYMHQFPELPQSAYHFLNMQHQEAESLTGIIPFNSTTGQSMGATAAAANGALSAAARRELGILRRLAEGMKKIGRKFIAMNQVFLSEEEVVRVTESEFITISRDDLAGNFDLRLSISTAEADEQKAKELSFMLQTTAQSMGLEFTKMILAEIADLRKMPHLSQQIKDFEPKPDPIAEQTAQLELAKLNAETAKIQAETQKILAEAELNRYKANNMQADTDQKNLDFVEQESGIAHARGLDQMEAQAEAQARTKVIEAALKSQEGNQSDSTV